MRKLLASVTLIGLLLPAAVSAATAEELAAQIQALLLQVQALQQQQGSTVQSGTATPTSLQCPHVSRVLKRGTTGADVTRLQQFLALDPAVYPEAQVTGYYGALTEAAVRRFQCKNKLVCDGTPESTGYGVTGPRTAALLALQCAGGASGDASSAGGFIRVTPTSGNAPLSVRIEATVNTTRSCAGGTYEVIYGDNSPSSIVTVPANNCNEVRQTFTHTYNGGTYTVILRSGVHQTSATVTVFGTTSGGGAPSGSTGGGAFSVTAGTDGDPLKVTTQFDLSSSCARYDLNWGDGSSRSTQSEGTCSSGSISKTITHTYPSAGSYTLTLKRGASLQTTDTVALVIVN